MEWGRVPHTAAGRMRPKQYEKLANKLFRGKTKRTQVSSAKDKRDFVSMFHDLVKDVETLGTFAAKKQDEYEDDYEDEDNGEYENDEYENDDYENDDAKVRGIRKAAKPSKAHETEYAKGKRRGRSKSPSGRNSLRATLQVTSVRISRSTIQKNAANQI